MTPKSIDIYHTVFPLYRGSPLDLYLAIYKSNHGYDSIGGIASRNKKHHEVYFCGPLTSAGAIRIPNIKNSDLIFQHNITAAEILRDALIPSLMKEAQGVKLYLTLPGRIPQGNGWGEGERNLFWLYYLSGVDPTCAEQFYKKRAIKKAIKAINDKNLGRHRKSVYLEMVDNYVEFVTDSQSTFLTNKMSKIIILPDSQYSFGSQMEMRLAKGLGIITEEVRLNPKWIRKQPGLWFNKYRKLNTLDGSKFIVPLNKLAVSVSLHSLK